MPATYAHYRFGDLALSRLSPEVQRTIRHFRQLYDVGLHGPDIFFYHNPLFQNPVKALGSKFHAQTGQIFFARVCDQLNREPSEAGLAYLYGLLCHYCLDSACHPFVNAEDKAGTVPHIELEVEFDRYLLEKDGRLPPHVQNTGGHLKLTPGECVTVSRFYPPASPEAVGMSVRTMAWAVRFLAGRHRRFLKRLLSLTPDTVSQQRMPEHPNRKCMHLDPVLQELYDRALEHYPRLLQQLEDYRIHGTPLGEDFASDFG